MKNFNMFLGSALVASALSLSGCGQNSNPNLNNSALNGGCVPSNGVFYQQNFYNTCPPGYVPAGTQTNGNTTVYQSGNLGSGTQIPGGVAYTRSVVSFGAYTGGMLTTSEALQVGDIVRLGGGQSQYYGSTGIQVVTQCSGIGNGFFGQTLYGSFIPSQIVVGNQTAMMGMPTNVAGQLKIQGQIQYQSGGCWNGTQSVQVVPSYGMGSPITITTCRDSSNNVMRCPF